MLSIGKLVDGQQRYYERTVAQGHDDYYSGRGEAPGVWTGRGAARLGLEGRVDAGQFNALMAGDDPRHPGRRLRSLTSDPQVAGFDLTFSAPKSVSVLFAIADERTSGELIQAHESAVHAALEYLQDSAVFVRRGKGGRVFERTGLVAAAYRHRMSRSLDPQLHTHVVCANLAEGEDGRWTALHHPSLYVHAQTAGYLYEAHLRAEVRERLGLEWGPVVKGIGDLVAVDEDVRAHFARRRQEMLAACADDPDMRMDTKQRAAAVAIATRDRKQYGVETGIWREQVRARAAEHGLDRQTVEAILADGRAARQRDLPAAAVDERAVGHVLAGPAGLTERSNTFGEREVLRAHAEVAQQGAPVEDVRARASRFIDRADVWPTQTGEMTTAELVACERRLIAAAIGRGHERCAAPDGQVLGGASPAGTDLRLTSEQRAAVRAVTSSGHGVDVIEARAGTGKTFIAGVIRLVYEQAGHRVIGVAPTGRAARELSEEARLPARTLDRLLLDLARAGGRLEPGTVIVFDEAGMASTRLSEQLLTAAEQSGAKVIAIGDPGQLASVRAGGWMRALGDRLGRQRLLEVHRQRDHGERRALAALHDRKPWLYLEWARRHQRITVHLTSAIASTLADWTTALAIHGPREAVLVARDNDTRERLNQLARAHRRERGEIGEDITYGPVQIAVGDRVIARQNDSIVDVDNGTRGTVRAVFADRIVVETDAGTIRELPAVYVSEHIEHAYCLTGHGMQGGTVEHATVLATPRDLTAGWSYTALSRARGATRLHIDAGEQAARIAAERSELAPHDAATPTPEPDDVLDQVARRMLIRDDQDLAVDQIGTRAPLAGLANDQQIHDARELGQQPQEHAAERGESLAPTDLAPQLCALADETRRLREQLQGLPLDEMRMLDHADQQRTHTGEQRAAAAAALAALPPGRRRLGRMDDPHAIERARLTSAIRAADCHLAALERQHAQLQARVGPLDQLRGERDGLTRRIQELERTREARLDHAAQAEVARRPDWLTRTLGPRPDDRRHARWWDRAALAAARFRVEHGVPDRVDGIGPKPERDQHRTRWRAVKQQLTRAHREIAHQDIGHER